MKVVKGEGPPHARFMLVGEAPGREEAEQGRPFVGRAGRFLNKALAEVGIDRKKVYITNVVKVRPTKTIKGKLRDRKPTKKEIEKWLPGLRREMKGIRPKVVVLLGGTAAEALLGKGLKLQNIHGKPAGKDSFAFLPTYHPAVAIRNRRYRVALLKDLKRAKRMARI
jgi:DNA polymerase